MSGDGIDEVVAGLIARAVAEVGEPCRGRVAVDGVDLDLQVVAVTPRWLAGRGGGGDLGYRGLASDAGIGWRVAAALTAGIGCTRLESLLTPGHYFLSLGRQDERLGDAAFDDRFLVKTNDLVALRAWLPPAALDELLATYEPTAQRPFQAIVTNGLVRLVSLSGWEVSPTAPARLDLAARAVARIVQHGRDLAEAWRERGARLGLVAEGRSFDVDGGFGLVATRRVPLRLDFPDRLVGVRRQGPRTRLRAPRAAASDHTASVARDELPSASRPRALRRGAPVSFGALTGRERGGPWLAATLAPLAGVLARATPDALEVTADEVVLRWERFVEDERVLAAALDLAEAIASPAAGGIGPYR